MFCIYLFANREGRENGKWQKLELKRTSHSTAHFADSSVSVQDPVYFLSFARGSTTKPSVKRKKKSEAARKRKYK